MYLGYKFRAGCMKTFLGGARGVWSFTAVLATRISHLRVMLHHFLALVCSACSYRYARVGPTLGGYMALLIRDRQY